MGRHCMWAAGSGQRRVRGGGHLAGAAPPASPSPPPTSPRPRSMSVVRTYCGHGIGDLFHCAPNVPHYAKNKAKGTMKVGEVFTIGAPARLGRRLAAARRIVGLALRTHAPQPSAPHPPRPAHLAAGHPTLPLPLAPSPRQSP